MKIEEYGQAASVRDAVLTETPSERFDKNNVNGLSLEAGEALWSYRTENRINGIPVDSSARGLPVDREDVLNAAFRLSCVPRSLMLWMDPDDKEANDRYDDLLRRVYEGSAVILDELKQYDASKGKFIVWIRYNEVCYQLHPRFKYLLEETSK